MPLSIDHIMRQVMAHVPWLEKDSQIYTNIKVLITTNEEKRNELISLLNKGVFI